MELANQAKNNNTVYKPINEQTFGNDLMERLRNAIKKTANTNTGEDNVCIYTKGILEAVICSNGIGEFLKTFNNGEIYNMTLAGLFPDGEQ